MDSGKTVVLGLMLSASIVLIALAAEEGRHQGLPAGECNFPAIFNFGDSNSNTGGFSASVFPIKSPNGMTFFGKPAGRLSDGRLILDFIAEHLGFPFLSSYLDSIGTGYEHGANFAVAAATIREQNDTPPFICPFYFERQTTHFDAFKIRTADLYDQDKDKTKIPSPRDFSKAVSVIDIGQNDLTRAMFGGIPQVVVPSLIISFHIPFKHLYDQGARVFWVHNVGPLGCMPSMIAQAHKMLDHDQYGCVKHVNQMVMHYNMELKSLVVKLRAELQEVAITYVDVYRAKYELIGNAKNLGFSDPFVGCKVEDKHGNLVSLCADPSKHISWDGVHFTEAANRLIAPSIFNGSVSDPPLPITQACFASLKKEED